MVVLEQGQGHHLNLTPMKKIMAARGKPHTYVVCKKYLKHNTVTSCDIRIEPVNPCSQIIFSSSITECSWFHPHLSQYNLSCHNIIYFILTATHSTPLCFLWIQQPAWKSNPSLQTYYRSKELLQLIQQVFNLREAWWKLCKLKQFNSWQISYHSKVSCNITLFSWRVVQDVYCIYECQIYLQI